MFDASTKKKPTNLRLIEIINSQKLNDIKVLDPPEISKSNKTKTNQKSTVKGKKIDNKTLKIRKRKDNDSEDMTNQIIQLTNYNTNTESVSIIETLPFRERSKQNKSRNEFSEGTHSICTFDVNEQIEKGRRMSHNRRASDIVKISWNKENSRSHSRNSLGFDRRMSYARKIHNRSCNDMEGGRVSKAQSREKSKNNHYLSCNDGQNITITPEKRKKTPKKVKKGSSQVTKNPTVKDINFKKVKLENKKKPVDIKQPKVVKKKEKEKEMKAKKDAKEAKQKRSVQIKEGSDQDQPEYPVSKYVSHRKKSLQISNNITLRNSIYEKMLSSNSSLIKSIETYKKQFDEQLIENEIKFIDIGESSLNLRQIRRYEQINKISEQKLKRERRKLYPDIIDHYPELNKQQIQFLSSVILVQRWWRKKRVQRDQEPDNNLTQIIKNILNNAIKSQESSLHYQLAETIKHRNEPTEKKKFFDSSQNEAPPPSREGKEIVSPSDSFNMLNIGDLQIPESRIRQQSYASKSRKNIEDEKFPPFDLLKEKRNDILRKYTSKMDNLQKKQSFEAAHEQHLIKQQMRRDLKQLDQDNKVIQKGYLTYLSCLQSLKTTPKSTSLLRKVSSSEGLMFELYKKTFKMEQYIQESESVQQLAKKVLIRKQWHKKKDSPIIHFGSDPSSPAHLSLLNNINKKDKLEDFIGRSAENIRNRGNNILSLSEILQDYKNEPVSEEASEDYESEIMANLLEEEIGEDDQIKVNEVIDMVMELVYLQFAEDIEDRARLRKKFTALLENRHIPGIDCSDSAIKYYLNIVVEQFLSTEKSALVECFNTPIGFSSESILKLMREPEFSPPDRYTPPVDSRSFLTVQKTYFEKIDISSIYKKNLTLVQELINIHNKAIYECFLSEIEQMKPNGENGMIHPWDAPRLINHTAVTSDQVYFKLTQAIRQVMKHCSFKAGLILENWVTRNARELQKAYEENQERVVAMITNDLEEEEPKWTDLDEFLLEVRLDVDVLVIQWVFEDAAKDLSLIK